MHANIEVQLPVAPRRSLRLLACTLTASLGLGSLPALAAPADDEAPASEQPIDTEALAMTAFNDGQAAYDRGEYQVALELFLEAQSLYPSPVFHYNIGRCYEALENYEQAITSYKAYLRSYKSSTGNDPDDKVNIENTVARLEKQVEAEQNEPDPAPVVTPVDQDPEPTRKPGRALVITGGVLTGLGAGALIIGGAVFGGQAMTVSRQLDEVYSGNPDNLTLAEARDLDAKGRSAELNQIIVMSAGSALAVTGVALLVVGVIKAKKAKSSGAEARLVPALAPSHAGFVLTGRF